MFKIIRSSNLNVGLYFMCMLESEQYHKLYNQFTGGSNMAGAEPLNDEGSPPHLEHQGAQG